MKKDRISILVISVILIAFACRQPENPQSETTATPKEGYITGADSMQLYYQIEGAGPDTLVMIHGGPGMDMGYMVADFEPLAKNHVLLYYDQRGGGRSSLPDTSVAMEALHIDRHIADLEALRQHFALSKMNLMGHSFGSIVAGLYAIAYPDKVKSMVLIGAVPPYIGDFNERYEKSLNSRMSPEELQQMATLSNDIVNGPDPKTACTAFWKIAMKPRIAAGLDVSILKGDCCTAPEEALRYGYRYTQLITWNSLGNWDFRQGLKKITAPTLLIHGEEESIPMDMIEQWVKFLPNSELVKVPEAAHFPYVEQPDKVWPVMERFMQWVMERDMQGDN